MIFQTRLVSLCKVKESGHICQDSNEGLLVTGTRGVTLTDHRQTPWLLSNAKTVSIQP